MVSEQESSELPGGKTFKGELHRRFEWANVEKFR
jgi:hypothetical protein